MGSIGVFFILKYMYKSFPLKRACILLRHPRGILGIPVTSSLIPLYWFAGWSKDIYDPSHLENKRHKIQTNYSGFYWCFFHPKMYKTMFSCKEELYFAKTSPTIPMVFTQSLVLKSFLFVMYISPWVASLWCLCL